MKKIILLMLIVTLTACSLNTASELRTNRIKWDNAKITHYRYSVFIGCFCAFMSEMPLTVEVQNGETISITTKDGVIVSPASTFYEIYDPYSTMERIMLNLEADLTGEADEVTVTYDPVYGYPATVHIDYITEAMDDEISYEITNFEILK